MNLTWHRQTLYFRTPWATAHGSASSKQTLVVALEHEGATGFGEVVPVSYHGQTLESAENALAEAKQQGIQVCLRDFVAALSACPSRLDFPSWELVCPALVGQYATLAGLDAACYDLAGRRAGINVCQWLRLAKKEANNINATPVPDEPKLLTDFSLGLDTPENTHRKAAEAVAAGFNILKIKLGKGLPSDDAATLRAVRSVGTSLTLRVDANEAWSNVAEAIERLKRLAEFNLELVEQPLPRQRFDDHRRLLDFLHALRPSPFAPRPLLILDEDCATETDLERCLTCADGVNVKLSKCGGITPAIRMIARARQAGLKIMLGCMAESSLGIAAAAQLGSLADFLDLDGHLLLAEGTDPWEGLCFANRPACQLCIDAHPGLGVVPRVF